MISRLGYTHSLRLSASFSLPHTSYRHTQGIHIWYRYILPKACTSPSKLPVGIVCPPKSHAPNFIFHVHPVLVSRSLALFLAPQPPSVFSKNPLFLSCMTLMVAINSHGTHREREKGDGETGKWSYSVLTPFPPSSQLCFSPFPSLSRSPPL